MSRARRLVKEFVGAATAFFALVLLIVVAGVLRGFGFELLLEMVLLGFVSALIAAAALTLLAWFFMAIGWDKDSD
jgi:hypothetical protein